jgi:hypothetical protein
MKPLCSIAGCGREAIARGWCKRHWERWYKHGDPTISLTNREHAATCSMDGCSRPYYALEVCRLHAERRRRHGDPTIAERLTASQFGRCAICRREPDGQGVESVLHLDHDHETGRVRGMLCGRCNKAIGLLRDDASLVLSIYAYLRPYPAAIEEIA